MRQTEGLHGGRISGSASIASGFEYGLEGVEGRVSRVRYGPRGNQRAEQARGRSPRALVSLGTSVFSSIMSIGPSVRVRQRNALLMIDFPVTRL